MSNHKNYVEGPFGPTVGSTSKEHQQLLKRRPSFDTKAALFTGGALAVAVTAIDSLVWHKPIVESMEYGFLFGAFGCGFMYFVGHILPKDLR